MKNLAGDKLCNVSIERELNRCRIPIKKIEKTTGEVAYSIIGKLGSFSFKRAWYYWMVDGLVPLSVAQELYDDPVGKEDIRVQGDCTRPAPEGNYIKWIAPDGKKVTDMKNKEEAEKFSKSKYESSRETGLRVLSEYYFSDNPEELGANPFITSYHIDTEIGLRLFADTIKKYNLD